MVVVAGCTDSESPAVTEVEQEPVATPAELLNQIVQFDEEIREASESDSLEEAHSALHKIGTAIESLRAGIESGSGQTTLDNRCLDMAGKLKSKGSIFSPRPVTICA